MHGIKLEVSVILPSPVYRHRSRFLWNLKQSGREAMFQISPSKLIGPIRYPGRNQPAEIWAVAQLPDRYIDFAPALTKLPDGNYRFKVVVNHNRATLRPILDSGALETGSMEVVL
jgi:hypothetical protein